MLSYIKLMFTYNPVLSWVVALLIALELSFIAQYLGYL